MDTVDFLDETELCERGLRRLADSRNAFVMRDGDWYRIIGIGASDVALTDDEAWDVLSALPRVRVGL